MRAFCAVFGFILGTFPAVEMALFVVASPEFNWRPLALWGGVWLGPLAVLLTTTRRPKIFVATQMGLVVIYTISILVVSVISMNPERARWHGASAQLEAAVASIGDATSAERARERCGRTCASDPFRPDQPLGLVWRSGRYAPYSVGPDRVDNGGMPALSLSALVFLPGAEPWSFMPFSPITLQLIGKARFADGDLVGSAVP